MAEIDDSTDVEVYPGAERPVAVPAEIVLAAQKEFRAYEAHQRGEAWDVIAIREGWPSANAARAAVRRYLTEGQVLAEDWTKAEMLALELAKLNRLRAAVWDSALEGKIPAVAMARQLTLDRIELLKLKDQADEDEQAARTVVVLGSEDDYVSTLQQVAQG